MRVGIAHCAFDDTRKASLDHLLKQLEGQDVYVSESHEKEHARVWAMRLWKWADSTGDDCILLNDDVDVIPELGNVVQAMTQTIPDRLFALHTTAAVAPSLAAAGERWLRSFWVTGPGYFFPKGYAKRLLPFAAKATKAMWSGNEDQVIICHAWSEKRPIWHSIPALVQHRTEIPSTLGYDNHPGRKSNVPWTGFKGDWTNPKLWKPEGPPLHVACPWLGQARVNELMSLFNSPQEGCVFCDSRLGDLQSNITGVKLCWECIETANKTVFAMVRGAP